MTPLDLAGAFRRLRAAPRFSLAVVATVAIAIAPILVSASLFEAVFLRGLSAKRPDRLVEIRSARGGGGGGGGGSRDGRRLGVSYPDYRDLRTAIPAERWRFMAAWTIRDASRTAPGGGELPLRVAAVAGDYFRIADARFVQGYAPPDDGVGVVVRRRLGRELAADGTPGELTVYGRRYPVVGMVDDEFRGVHPNEGIDAWIPLAALPRLEGDPNLLSYRELESLTLVVQSAHDDGPASFAPSVAAVSAGLSSFHEGTRTGWHLEAVGAAPAPRELVSTPAGQAAVAPLVVLVCVLLIGATNVANLFVIRAAARQHELQVRLALGVSRTRLLLSECLEPILLGAAGLGVGLWAGSVALHRIAGHPVLERLRLHPSAVAVLAAVAAAGVFVVCCALMPALRIRGLREGDIIHQGPGMTTRGVSRVQRTFLVLQFTLALAFTGVAVQLAEGVRQQRAVDVGFDVTNLMVVTGALGAAGRSPAERLSDYGRVTAAVGALPGVVAVSASVSQFFGGFTVPKRPITIARSGDPASDGRILAGMDVVGAGFFATLGLPMRAGREFTADDRPGQPARILVNETLARRVSADGSPLGMILYEFGTTPLQIVGVVPDVRATAAERADPTYFRSLNQSPLPSFVLYARLASPSASRASAIVAAIVSELPESAGRLRLQTAEGQRRERDLPATVIFWLSTGLSAIAALISGLGLYGVASCAALARRREHGIRASLGATPAQLARSILGEGLRWTALAATFSLPFVWVGMRVTSALVVGMRQVPLLAAGALLVTYVVVALVALTVPASRAARVNPAVALKAPT